jgi:hypothetical protein
MKRLFLFAAVAGLGLVSAGPPGEHRTRAQGHGEDAYPPCSRTVRDNCIQLYERGVRRHRDGAHHRRQDEYGGSAHGRHGPRHDDHGRDEHARDEHARDNHGRHDHHGRPAARRSGHHAYARHASRCAVRCHHHRRTVAYRVRRAGERG